MTRAAGVLVLAGLVLSSGGVGAIATDAGADPGPATSLTAMGQTPGCDNGQWENKTVYRWGEPVRFDNSPPNETVVRGETVNWTVGIMSAGEYPGRTQVNLTVDGETVATTCEMGGILATIPVSLEHDTSELEPGTYVYTVELRRGVTRNATVEVLPSETPEPVTTETETPEETPEPTAEPDPEPTPTTAVGTETRAPDPEPATSSAAVGQTPGCDNGKWENKTVYGWAETLRYNAPPDPVVEHGAVVNWTAGVRSLGPYPGRTQVNLSVDGERVATTCVDGSNLVDVPVTVEHDTSELEPGMHVYVLELREGVIRTATVEVVPATAEPETDTETETPEPTATPTATDTATPAATDTPTPTATARPTTAVETEPAEGDPEPKPATTVATETATPTAAPGPTPTAGESAPATPTEPPRTSETDTPGTTPTPVATGTATPAATVVDGGPDEGDREPSFLARLLEWLSAWLERFFSGL